MTKKARVVDSITLLVNVRTMQLIDEIIRMCFNISGQRPASDVIRSNTLKHTSLKIEHGVVEVDESKDDSAIDSKDTAVLRIVPTTISGLL